MKVIEKKINWKILCIAFCCELVLSYILPFMVYDNFKFDVVFPIIFLTMYNKQMNSSLFNSMLLNPFALLLDVVFIYILIQLVIKVVNTIKNKQYRRLQHNE